MGNYLAIIGFNYCTRWNNLSLKITPRLCWIWLPASDIVKACHSEGSGKSAIYHKGHSVERGNSVAD